MSNQPNEAAIKALAMLAASRVEARMEHDPCDDCGADGGTPCDDDCGRAADERTVTQGVDAIASLRSALTNAEKRIEEHERWRTQHGAAYQQVADARDAALAKLAEAEKRADSLRLETNCARNERDSAIDDWGALKSEREALAAQLAEARGLLGEALPWVIRLLNHADPDCPICGGHATPESSGHRKSCTVRRMSAFLTPPSGRGADTQASGRAVPRETIERLGLQMYYDAPSDRGAEGES